MTLRTLPLAALDAHPENANRMAPRALEVLRRHVARTGRYEPLTVRPACGGRYQILNGHHRARVLRDLGHTQARCDVWEVEDEEARLLLATLNRLEGRDDPTRRAALVARLAEGRSPRDLARFLPEPPDGIERLLALAQPPPDLRPPADAAPPFRPMTFFLRPEQHAAVTEALAAIARAAMSTRPDRAERLERLACWYLEACGRE